MVKHCGVGIFCAVSRRRHGLSAESEALGLSSRVRRAAPSRQMQSEETVMASYGPSKTAILTMLCAQLHRDLNRVELAADLEART